MSDYQAATTNLDLRQMVFMQCDCLPGQNVAEARWVAELMEQDTRLAGMVAFAPLEKGESVRADLDDLLAVNPKIKGIRRLLQGQPDLDFCLQPDFMAGVSLLAEYGLPFDLCLNYRHLPYVIEFARQVPQVQMVVDHIGKPDIKGGEFDLWAQGMAELAELEHVHCKLSSLATEADQQNWQLADLRPYLNHVIQHFGVERCFFASDWPVVTLAASLETSVHTLYQLLEGHSDDQLRAIFSENGKAFYQI
ncbi:MAG: amidohydrolase family protein [Bacteroidota bacterium]